MRQHYLVIFCVGVLLACILPYHAYAKTKTIIPDSLQELHYQINDVVFSMKRVEGGVFVMGGTPEQHKEQISTDLPAHTVALDVFYMGTTEVTQDLWQAVMPEWYVDNELHLLNHPVTGVSWHDCQEFIRRLDSITGLPFRLPTESEWEFAARGGNQSKGYRFAGSNKIDDVSWSLSNAGLRKHSVGIKGANELGLYDMTGNVSEWCSDWYGRYYLGTEPNPEGEKEGEWKVVRGGSFDKCTENSHLSHREYYEPYLAMNHCGFRLALTLPNDPSMEESTEPSIIETLKIKNLRIKLYYVPGEVPYYISEKPINQRIWDKVNNVVSDESWSQVVVDKSDSEWDDFLEKCRQQSHSGVMFATESEVNQAIAMDITEMPTTKKKKPKRWEKNVQSIQRHRRTATNAQKWADLIGVEIQSIDDPILQVYNNQGKKSVPRWLVLH